ncbi:lytic transglycosylase domain-containing protein [Telmatospirillum sp. J64-1]|uniref:lytic transglycosylase domain-containing protein n=1 Tax=Telmatospirillum sp. J64-1 TaxID=2502183 RepID=UPI00115C6DBB|nr:lytic transglycosylase domain-containing protein [Telmatospirillum sp. J64-1]
MRKKLLPALLAATMALSGPASAESTPASTAGDKVATLGSGAIRQGRKAEIPKPLSVADAGRYTRIFELQGKGQWGQADRLIAQLEDRMLLGHVLAQRLLHPHYKSPAAELVAWMAEYADHPDADRIYSLARKRAPGQKIKSPQSSYLDGTGIRTRNTGADWEDLSYERTGLSAAQRNKIREIKTRARSMVRQGQAESVLAMLDEPRVKLALDQYDADDLRTLVGAGFFAAGEDKRVIELLTPVAKRSGDVIPWAHWKLALALWRQGDHEKARPHFEAVARGRDDGSGWMIAAGAYWAGRANLVTRRPEAVNHWLEIAAEHSRTFYGQLARRALNMGSTFSWEQAPFTDLDAELIQRVERGKRILGLMQIGRRDLAEEEIRRLAPSATPALTTALLALANAGGMPEVALRLGSVVASQDGRFHDAVSFPMPPWQPQGGWKVDKALVFAIVRQESTFVPTAVSPAGAAGLMQLMPATARFLAGGPVERSRLLDPEYNLSLGQTYIQRLLDDPAVQGNLFKLVVAYNSGPGNLQRWLDTLDYQGDPLLFIESIPARETRIFIEKVMSNFWIYRHRMGQPALSLDHLVSGEWPLYDAMDRVQRQVAKNVSN